MASNSYFSQLPTLDYPSLANDRQSSYDYIKVKNIFNRKSVFFAKIYL